MNRVNFNAEEIPLPLWEKRAKTYVLKALKFLEKDRWDLSVLFCGNNCIRQLNNRYRNKDEATDVLSFALGETERGRYLSGDIVISLETLDENAKYFKVQPDEELRRLLVHGILHLSGMDHKTNKADEPMLQLQEKVLASLAGDRII
ncbi:MAG: rRNA maturation RNase YbeY [Treponema sp.]|jgi:probable rRNA maturation factor|nr:rRNA maturation RNase YbeY [Treponema sp.]